MKCAKCGKAIKSPEKRKTVSIRKGPSDIKEIVYCLECFKEYVKELDSRKSCNRCAYFRCEREDGEFFDYYTYYCKKLDIELEPSLSIRWGEDDGRKLYQEAEQCVYFIDEEEYRKKALKER